jgi:DNA-binding CsgD family transcriptional regulator
VLAVRAPAFTGRRPELAALADTLAGAPAVVLVEGEAGIGKTRLVQEFLALPEGSKLRTLVTGCPPVRQPFTLGPVVDALRRVTGDVAGLGLSGLAGVLRPLFPEWAAGLPPPPEPLPDASAARFRLFRALAELISCLGFGALMVEDVHWADEATLEFLLSVCQRVSVLVTYRPEDLPQDSLLLRLARLAAGTNGLRLTLAPLDMTETASVVSSMLGGGAVSREFAAFLHRGTEGVPLAVEESVRLLRDRRDLARRGGEWVRRSLGELAVPPTVRDAVLERVGRLDAAAQAILRAAAVLTDPVSEPVLVSVSGLGEDAASEGLAAALVSGLLTESRLNGSVLVSFWHALAARAVYEAIPGPECRRAHLRAAHALETVSPPPLAQLARHFREAGQTVDWCRYAEQAADLALVAGDHKTAATLLHDLIIHGAPPVGDVVRLAQKLPLAALGRYDSLGDLARSFQAALRAGALASAERAELGCLLGRLLLCTGEYGMAAEELEHAVPGLVDHPVEAAQAMVQLGWPAQTLWPADVHRRWVDRAAAVTENASISEASRLGLAGSQAVALLLMGEEDGWKVAAGIPANATRPQEALEVAKGCMNIGDAAIRWGRYGEARWRLLAALGLARSLDYPILRDGTLVTLAHLDWFTGAWEGLAGSAAALAALKDDDPLFGMEAVLVTAFLEAASGAFRDAQEKLRRVLAEWTEHRIVDLPLEPAAALARLCLANERLDEALALTEEPVQVITAKRIWLWATDVLPVRVRALIVAGRHGEASGLVNAFAGGLRGRDVPAPRAALATCRAVLAEHRDEPGRAVRAFGRAAAAWQALPRPYEALLAQEAQSNCLINKGCTEDGLALLTEVRGKLASLGATGDADRIVATLREHGVQARRAQHGGQRGYGNELSPREAEVVRLVVDGRTNREIAHALCRSPDTVKVQLRSAMRKLGVSSRTALAVRAADTGLIPGPRATRGGIGGGSGILEV